LGWEAAELSAARADEQAGGRAQAAKASATLSFL
jgi:hypothetical protein